MHLNMLAWLGILIVLHRDWSTAWRLYFQIAGDLLHAARNHVKVACDLQRSAFCCATHDSWQSFCFIFTGIVFVMDLACLRPSSCLL